MGYHPGLEDDGIYLSALKSDLNPGLYPHDAEFFKLQTQATAFDGAMAAFVRLTHIPVSWAELLWQFLSLYAILWAAHSIAQRLFRERRAQWAAVALLAAMFTLPVAGTALYIADQHLHPRNIATALILVGADRALAGKGWQALPFLLAAITMHPIMAAFGTSFCLFLGAVLAEPIYLRLISWLARTPRARVAAALPLSWIFEPPTPEWRRALDTRTYYFLYQWRWFEWLGAVAPLALFWLLWRCMSREINNEFQLTTAGSEPGHDFDRAETRPKSKRARDDGSHPSTYLHQAGGQRPGPLLARFALALFLYGAFQQCVAMVLLAPAAWVRLMPLQPMRYLHLEYLFLVLIAGGLLGRHLLGRRAWRWAFFLVIANGAMFLFARISYPATEHLELPGRPTRNPWVQAFEWIRENTPRDAYFAIDPRYLAVPGEDYHSFRALAERSQLADAVKDAAVVTQVPRLAERWATEVDAQKDWDTFQLADFEQLKARFGVDWVLLSNTPPSRLTCKWRNERLWVCRLPGGTPGSRNSLK